MVLQEEAPAQRLFDMSWLAEFLDDLSEFDRAMNKAVTDSGILAHVPRRVLAKEGVAQKPPDRIFNLLLRDAAISTTKADSGQPLLPGLFRTPISVPCLTPCGCLHYYRLVFCFIPTIVII